VGGGRHRGNRTRPRHRPGLAGAGRRLPAGRDPRHQRVAGHRDHRRDRPDHVCVPHPGAPGVLDGLCRSAAQSGTRHGKGKAKAKKGNSYARAAAGQAAIGAAGTATFLGERYARIARRRGKAIAQVAVARSIINIVWHLLSDPAARYRDLGPDFYASRISRDKKIRTHIRGLTALDVTAEDICAALGIAVADIPSGGHAA